ncbi:unnamed protein product [Coffea canephora]|uniref:DH200=94 genomic scaffold, scaffold_395 n=1 Tax=Coffea canephora TaxID=49390 RepID=A0A068VEX5_COFCA|nr:unnamed protein product [Coffea canephora]
MNERTYPFHVWFLVNVVINLCIFDVHTLFWIGNVYKFRYKFWIVALFILVILFQFHLKGLYE